MKSKSNKITAKLPKHLQSFVIPQSYEEYTAQNQAVWRYVMRKNVKYLSKVAHKSYLDGLEKAGISIDMTIGLLAYFRNISYLSVN